MSAGKSPANPDMGCDGAGRGAKRVFAYQQELRSLASQLLLVEERERRYIAENLHDNVGQNLALARIKLSALEKILKTKGYGGHVREIRELIEQTIQYTRSLTHDLSPAILYEFGFEAAVESLAEELRERHGLVVEIENDRLPKPLNGEVRVLLYRAVRELLINIIKHARASRADISLTRNGKHVLILLKDDGIGFDASRLGTGHAMKHGFGLFNIKERLESIEGCFDIASVRGRGTTVAMMAPLVDEKQGRGGV